jgi:hypothetical protein
MTTTATQPLLEGGNGHRRSTRSRSLLPVLNSDSEAGAPGFVEKQLSEAAQLLLVEAVAQNVPDECDGAVGRAIEIRRNGQRAGADAARRAMG